MKFRLRAYLNFSAKSIIMNPHSRKAEPTMNEYEICIETINPCGGSKHAIREIIEAECESPEAYVKENGRFPIIDTIENADGDKVIITGDGKGYIIRYTFSE